MTGNALEIIEWLYHQTDKDKQFDIKEHKVKRSLNANAYAWTLIGKIADIVGNTKEDVYRDFIKNKGIYKVVTINKEAVPTFIKIWNDRGLGWVCETMDTKISGLVEVLAYYGTSSYNTKQMANFIDYIVQEAKSLGIQTLTPNEIEHLKSLWGSQNE